MHNVENKADLSHRHGSDIDGLPERLTSYRNEAEKLALTSHQQQQPTQCYKQQVNGNHRKRRRQANANFNNRN